MRPIFYDTETTGVRSDKDRVVELAAFDPVQNRTFVQLINPGIPIPPEASAIHGISNEMVASAPPFSEVGAAFIEFCHGHVVLIAHNNDSFDKPFLENEYKRHNLQIPSWQFVDSLKWSRKYRPDLPRHTLQSLREVYGIEANQAHRALDDVIVLQKVCAAMFDDLPMEVVMQLISRPMVLTRMPFGKHQGKPLAEIPRHYVQWLHENGALDKPDNKTLRESLEKLGLLQLN